MATGGKTRTVWQQNPKSYDFVKVEGLSNLPEVYFPIATLRTGLRELGIYEFKFSINYNFNVTNKSVFLAYSLDGGKKYYEFVAEPKDKTDNKGYSYFFVIDHPGGRGFDIRFKIKKEDGTGVLNVNYFDAIIERKG